MNQRAIAAAILTLGAVAVPATSAHAQRAPEPWSEVARIDDLAPQTPPGTSVDNAERIRDALARVLALVNGSIDATSRYHTPYDTSYEAAHNRSAVEDLRRG